MIHRRPATLRSRLHTARHLATAALFGASLTMGAACSPGTGEGDAGPELTEWLGAEPHFAAMGRLNGEDIDVWLEGDAASDAGKLFCEREYAVNLVGGEPDWTTGRVFEVKINATVSVGDEERVAVIEFKQHDMSKDAAGTKVTVVPRDDANLPASNEMWVEWEWSVGDTETYEGAAQSGTVTVGEFSGDPDDTGVVVPKGEGNVGVYFEAEWSETESMKVSATAPCMDNAIEEIAQ